MIHCIKGSAASGKTTKAIEIAVERAREGKNVLFINNEETQETLVAKILETIGDVPLDGGDITVVESDNFRLTDIQSEIHNYLGREMFNVMVLDVVGVACLDKGVEPLQSYLKKMEHVHSLDIAFTIDVMRKDGQEAINVVVDEVWKDIPLGNTQQSPLPFEGLMSIDVTNASKFTDDTPRHLYQSLTGDYVGKLLGFEFYGYEK
ncbi:hypothetical protein phiAS5_ORF0273 [Aeromonas phage phiAS5]|uniref:Uncharacterized protein n=1 Tax=Aeromonas phage phiAS5 TaxID=879630 RepID=E1A227_9CAUD|nr:hypothetical protein phiAS5_ORF0273 [Aeromonas phage phiAS5]ADM80116.1 hypothetical protein phiAS5_ORF0273 [Aeromonas phage phiAS5]BES53121.1 hypothetical protein [Aeromonas phage phiWae14]